MCRVRQEQAIHSNLARVALAPPVSLASRSCPAWVRKALSCLIGDSDTGRAVHSRAHPTWTSEPAGQAQSPLTLASAHRASKLCPRRARESGQPRSTGVRTGPPAGTDAGNPCQSAIERPRNCRRFPTCERESILVTPPAALQVMDSRFRPTPPECAVSATPTSASKRFPAGEDAKGTSIGMTCTGIDVEIAHHLRSFRNRGHPSESRTSGAAVFPRRPRWAPSASAAADTGRSSWPCAGWSTPRWASAGSSTPPSPPRPPPGSDTACRASSATPCDWTPSRASPNSRPPWPAASGHLAGHGGVEGQLGQGRVLGRGNGRAGADRGGHLVAAAQSPAPGTPRERRSPGGVAPPVGPAAPPMVTLRGAARASPSWGRP